MAPEEDVKAAEMVVIEVLTAINSKKRHIALEIGREKKEVFNHQNRMARGKEFRSTTKISKLSNRTIRLVIQKAQTGESSARKIAGMVRNDIKTQISVQFIQQIIFRATQVEYLNLIKGLEMTTLNNIDRLKWALK